MLRLKRGTASKKKYYGEGDFETEISL